MKPQVAYFLGFLTCAAVVAGAVGWYLIALAAARG